MNAKLFITLFFSILFVGCQEEKISGPFTNEKGTFYLESNDTIYFNYDSSLNEVVLSKEKISIVFENGVIHHIWDFSSIDYEYFIYTIDKGLSLSSVSIPYSYGLGKINYEIINDSVNSLGFYTVVSIGDEEMLHVIPEQKIYYVKGEIDESNSFFYTYNHSEGDLDSAIRIKNDFAKYYTDIINGDTVNYTNCKIDYMFTRGSIWELPLFIDKKSIFIDKGVPAIPNFTRSNTPYLIIKFPLEYDYVVMMFLKSENDDILDYEIRPINKFYGSSELRDSIKNELEQVMNDFNDNNRVEYFMKKISNYSVIKDMKANKLDNVSLPE